MFATALWNSWVNVNRHQHNQSPSTTLCGPYSSYGAEDLTLCLFHRIDAICQCYQEQAACCILCPSLSLGAMKHMSLFSTVNERLTLLPRRQGMFAFRTQTHLTALCRRFMQSPSLLHSFSSAFSPDVVSSSSPRSFAPLHSVPPPGDLSQPLTASGALLDWIYMICPSINGERERERNGSLSAKRWDRDARRRRKIGTGRHLQTWTS